MSYPPVNKLTFQERAANARTQYANRVQNDIPVQTNTPQPISGRYFLWYGWFDARVADYPIFYTKLVTLQCSHIFPNGTRCKKEVCLGSDLCVQHLELMGVSVTTKYKHHSRVVDKISRVYSNRYFKKDELVLRLYGENHSLQDHID